MAQKETFAIATNSEASFNEAVKFKGLAVVDVHANWCGPCRAMNSTIKKLYFEYSDRPIRFVTADADNIPAFNQYAKKSMPVFKFYKDGELFETVLGANGPKVFSIVVDNLPAPEVKETEQPAAAESKGEEKPANVESSEVAPAEAAPAEAAPIETPKEQPQETSETPAPAPEAEPAPAPAE